MQIQGSAALVTGASSGIGREIARELARRGAKTLILVARRKERLEALAQELKAVHTHGFDVRVEPCDVSDLPALDALVARAGSLDILVNCAGFGNFALLDKSDPVMTEQMIRINVLGLYHLARRFVPGMVERKRGAILNVSSAFGMTWLPGFSAYVGTKFFVHGFCESLRADLSGTGVTVTELAPGPVHTEFQAVTGDMYLFNPPAFLQMSAERCARIAVRGLARGKSLVVPGILFKFVVVLVKFTPMWVTRLALAPFGRLIRKRNQ